MKIPFSLRAMQMRGAGAPSVSKLDKNARIAIVGAGISGIGAARELAKHGYKNVVLFEKDDDVGGKSHTVQIDGKPYDLGATMGVHVDYREVIKLAKEAKNELVHFPKVYVTQTGETGVLERKFENVLSTMIDMFRYARIHHGLRGVNGEELHNASAELLESRKDFLESHGLHHFRDVTERVVASYGYGYEETTPALYLANMIRISTLLGFLRKPFYFEHGTQPIWQKAAEHLNVKTGVTVDRVDPTLEGIELSFTKSEQSATLDFDRVLVTTDPEAALRLMPAREARELSFFDEVETTDYWTVACEIKGLTPEGQAAAVYCDDNIALGREGQWLPLVGIKRHADSNIFVFHIIGDPAVRSEEDALAKIETALSEHMGRQNAKLVAIRDYKRWPNFFPHAGVPSAKAGFYEKLNDVQNATPGVFFAGGYTSFECMPRALESGVRAAHRMIEVREDGHE